MACWWIRSKDTPGREKGGRRGRRCRYVLLRFSCRCVFDHHKRCIGSSLKAACSAACHGRGDVAGQEGTAVQTSLRREHVHTRAAKRREEQVSRKGKDTTTKKERKEYDHQKRKPAEHSAGGLGLRTYCASIVERNVAPPSHPLPVHKSQLVTQSIWSYKLIFFARFSQRSSRGTPPAPPCLCSSYTPFDAKAFAHQG